MLYITKLPFDGIFKITHPYGANDINYLSGIHQGIDIVNTNNPDVYSINYGTVIYTGWENSKNKKQGFGLYVSVKCDVTDKGYKKVIYAHLDEVRVSAEQKVDNTTIIGVMGNTGLSINPHLHVEIREYNSNHQLIKIINPAIYMGIENNIGIYNSTSYRIYIGKNNYITGRYKVTSDVGLVIRKAAGMNNLRIRNNKFPNGEYSYGQVFDVFEIKENWGRTPSGWVCLDYAIKLQ